MKYRKKPVVIEAFQMTKERREDNSEWPEWLHSAWSKPSYSDGSLQPANPGSQTERRLYIMTLEGALVVQWNDWIIQGVQGELYPCKPHIFEATYEAVP